MKGYILILLSLLFITSCVETVIVGTATTGFLVKQERKVSSTKDDAWISAQIDKKFITAGLKSPANKIGVSVNEQRVLLTGIVNRDAMVKMANKLAWEVEGVREVIDEIQVVRNKSMIKTFFNYFSDTSITTQIDAKILFSNNASLSNIKVITINRIVYLIGIAKSQAEIVAVNEIASKTWGVNKVINHVILASDSRIIEK
ncbi:MAG: putative lipoprotein [Rickettsiaceae bacterium]|jgi:osmotically-inducible protein OsmY|nr:putative lipoprotein [Rickettsiaceae bacterium]